MNAAKHTMEKPYVLPLIAILLSVSISACTDSGDDGGDDTDTATDQYRQYMRQFVINISAYARAADPGFILIPQNGHDLLSLTPGAAGPPALDYIKAIDGMGQEDLLYGYDGDDKATPAEATARLQSLLDLGEANGLQALVIDYCSTHTRMDDSYSRNLAKGYISFAADHRDLDNVPAYPAPPFNMNTDNVTTLAQAKNFLYLINPGGFSSKEAFLDALRGSAHDVLVIDAFYEDAWLTKDEVESLKTKPGGGSRLVISYMSIGEAEDYRYYWRSGWKPGSPSFVDKENPDWEGNYKVRYWDPEWQKVICGQQGSYTDHLLSAGFDGAYLDIIDAFEYYE